MCSISDAGPGHDPVPDAPPMTSRQKAQPAAATSTEKSDSASRNLKLVLLGTNGGPMPSPSRFGISQAVVVNGRVYLIDCGYGVTAQLRRARLLVQLHQVFITHLHSDHDEDYFNLFLQGRSVLQYKELPLHVYGPGPAGGEGALPVPLPGEPAPPLVNPMNPTPGLIDMTNYQIQAHAYDINLRNRTGLPDVGGMLVPHEIVLPPAVGASGPDNVAPSMEPIRVMEDDDVRVTAILVSHAPVFPSYAYRFDTADGSIVISGDTSPSPNLVKLARGADILVHEVCDLDYLRALALEQARMEHMLISHTSVDEVGKVAAEAEVNKLVLSHFVPCDDVLADEEWASRAQVGFGGEVIVGKELLEVHV